MNPEDQSLIISLEKEIIDLKTEVDFWRSEYNKAMEEVVKLNIQHLDLIRNNK